ncbi:MAG: tetratricopeptide repeat protein [Archangium sp.]
MLLAGIAVAAPPKPQPVVAFLPPSSTDASLQQLGLLMVARASELTEETKKVNELHIKQVVRAVAEEGFAEDLRQPANADALRGILGADRAVSFSLEVVGENYELAGVTVDGKKPKTFNAKLPKTWSGALEQGSVALAKAILPGIALPAKSAAQPSSTNEDALKALGQCYPVVLRQPLSPDTPALVETVELTRAAEACAKAVELDPKLRFALASGALAQAILGGDGVAAKALAGLGESDDMLETYTLARFWLLTRYQSNEAGVAFLTDIVKKRPGELIARSYLGDTLFALGNWAEAEKVWRAYSEQVPNSAYAYGRVSKALARQNKHDEALVAARKGFALSATSTEARLELGSRLIDAGKVQEAQDVLSPLAQLNPARGEHLLRLGWAHWLEGELDPAQAYFQRALDVSNAPGEWRTRGRAAYDLALVAAKQNRADAAKAALKISMNSGLKLKDVDASLTAFVRDIERADVGASASSASAKDGGTGGARASLVPRESSLFPVDSYGELDPKAKKPAAPDGLVLYRF